MIKLGVNSVLFQGTRPRHGLQAHRLARATTASSCRPSRACASTSTSTTGRRRPARSRRSPPSTGLALLSHGGGLARRGPPAPRPSRPAPSIGIPVVNIGPGGKADVGGGLRAPDRPDRQDGRDRPRRTASRSAARPTSAAASTTRPPRCAAMEKITSPGLRHRHGPQPHLPRRRGPRAGAAAGAQPRQAHPHPRLQGHGPQPRRPREPGLRPRRHRPVRLLPRRWSTASYDGPVCLEVIGAGKLGTAPTSPSSPPRATAT